MEDDRGQMIHGTEDDRGRMIHGSETTGRVLCSVPDAKLRRAPGEGGQRATSGRVFTVGPGVFWGYGHIHVKAPFQKTHILKKTT